MSAWIDAQLRELRALRKDVQAVIDALDPPKPKRKYTRRALSLEQRELDVALRASTREKIRHLREETAGRTDAEIQTARERADSRERPK